MFTINQNISCVHQWCELAENVFCTGKMLIIVVNVRIYLI